MYRISTFALVLAIWTTRISAQQTTGHTYEQVGQQQQAAQQQQAQFTNEERRARIASGNETERNSRQMEADAGRQLAEQQRLANEVASHLRHEFWQYWTRTESRNATSDAEFNLVLDRLQDSAKQMQQTLSDQRQSRMKRLQQSAPRVTEAQSSPEHSRSNSNQSPRMEKTEATSVRPEVPTARKSTQPTPSQTNSIQDVTVNDQTPRVMIAMNGQGIGFWSIVRGVFSRNAVPSPQEKFTGPAGAAANHIEPALSGDPIVSTNEQTNQIRAAARKQNRDLRGLASVETDSWEQYSATQVAAPRDLSARSEWLGEQATRLKQQAKLCEANADAVRALWAWDRFSDFDRWWVSTTELDNEARRQTLDELARCQELATRAATRAANAKRRIDAKLDEQLRRRNPNLNQRTE